MAYKSLHKQPWHFLRRASQVGQAHVHTCRLCRIREFYVYVPPMTLISYLRTVDKILQNYKLKLISQSTSNYVALKEIPLRCYDIIDHAQPTPLI